LNTITHTAKMTATAAKILANASKALKIGMMPADGIGREVLPVAQRVLSLTPGAPKFEFIPLPAGFELFTKTGVALPEETIRCLKEECDGAMFGSVSSPSHKVEGYSSPIVQLRKNLDLYANIRPVVGVRGTRDEDKWVDTVIVRENTECLVSQRRAPREQGKYLISNLTLPTRRFPATVHQVGDNRGHSQWQGRQGHQANIRARLYQDRKEGL
jgi:homoisocitrate dehydrogenase